MKRAILVSLASLACVASAAPALNAADESKKPSSCAFVRSIDRWSPIDDESAIIYTSPRRKFKVTFATPCRDLKWAIVARLDTRPSAGICLSPGDVLVFARGTLFPTSNRFEFEERCMIKTIEALPLGEGYGEPAAPPAPATPH